MQMGKDVDFRKQNNCTLCQTYTLLFSFTGKQYPYVHLLTAFLPQLPECLFSQGRAPVL